jgi:hypothetical protein
MPSSEAIGIENIELPFMAYIRKNIRGRRQLALPGPTRNISAPRSTLQAAMLL